MTTLTLVVFRRGVVAVRLRAAARSASIDVVNEAIAGLAGALIGALAALGGQWLTVRHQRGTDRRGELVELVSKVWANTDQLWRASQGLEHAVISMGNVDGQNNPDLARMYNEHREDSLSKQHVAETSARLGIAQMRLLYPRIANEATALCDASTLYENGRRLELREKRETALNAYERAARKELT